MIVVCDTSPSTALACADRLDLLRAVHGKILVPDAVYDEITIAGAGEPGASHLNLLATFNQLG
jgi:predicted nucleic acid-binding protein